MVKQTLLQPAKALFYRGQSMAVLCKVECRAAKLNGGRTEEGEYSLQVKLGAVWEGTPEKQWLSENMIFGKNTPHMEVVMTIKNPQAAVQFVEGKQYYVTFSPID